MRSVLGSFILLASFVAFAKPLDDAQAAFKRGDYATTFKILEPLAAAGDADALGNLGNMYAFGQGVERDLSKAAELWTKAADKGLGTAMGNLAQLYSSGLGGITQDPQRAAEWYKKAAEHRHVPSMLRLSVLYKLGGSVEKNLVNAIAWAALAASNAPNAQIKAMAEQQARDFASVANTDEITAAQKLADELIKIIDANVTRYKAGQAAQQGAAPDPHTSASLRRGVG